MIFWTWTKPEDDLEFYHKNKLGTLHPVRYNSFTNEGLFKFMSVF